MLVDRVINFFTSLRLTVVCLGLAVVLIFIGTLAQVDLGLYKAQAQFFQSFFIYWTPGNSNFKIPVFPGGYLVGGVLFVNLIAAHIKRFSLTRKKIGIFMIHGGVILLLLGQFITDVFQVESTMRITEGEAKNYSENQRATELAFVDPSPADHDKVVAIPERLLKPGEKITHPDLPFSLQVQKFYSHSTLRKREGNQGESAASRGVGSSLLLEPQPEVTDMNLRNVPSAVFELMGPSGSAGTWLVSLWLEEPQTVEVNGKQFQISLRDARYYKPYSIELVDFTHERYKGTTKPKNFSSRVRLNDPDSKENREVLIYMNNPLRYGGETYYQGSFGDKDAQGNPIPIEEQRVSILQVVRNPGWLTPYFSCGLVALGLLTQFMTHLVGFVRKRMKK